MLVLRKCVCEGGGLSLFLFSFLFFWHSHMKWDCLLSVMWKGIWVSKIENFTYVWKKQKKYLNKIKYAWKYILWVKLYLMSRRLCVMWELSHKLRLSEAVNKTFSEHLQQTRIPSGSRVSIPSSGPEMSKPQVAVTPVAMSKLSVKAPEFYPSGYNPNFNQNLAVSVNPLLAYSNFLLCFLDIFKATFA